MDNTVPIIWPTRKLANYIFGHSYWKWVLWFTVCLFTNKVNDIYVSFTECIGKSILSNNSARYNFSSAMDHRRRIRHCVCHPWLSLFTGDRFPQWISSWCDMHILAAEPTNRTDRTKGWFRIGCCCWFSWRSAWLNASNCVGFSLCICWSHHEWLDYNVLHCNIAESFVWGKRWFIAIIPLDLINTFASQIREIVVAVGGGAIIFAVTTLLCVKFITIVSSSIVGSTMIITAIDFFMHGSDTVLWVSSNVCLWLTLEI